MYATFVENYRYSCYVLSMERADKTTEKQRGKPFKRGQSGNPKGRPKGSRNKTSIAVDALLDGEAENLTRKCIERAIGGDSVALRLCMERICPPRKDRPVIFEAPKMQTASDAVNVMASVLSALADGNLTPSEAGVISGLVETYRKTIETSNLEARIQDIERAQN